MIEIELLYFDECPSWQPALENLRQALIEENIPHRIRKIKIATLQQAQEEHFLGSPSFRVNGADMWPETRERYDLNCRVYATEQGMRGSPTICMFRERIQAILAH